MRIVSLSFGFANSSLVRPIGDHNAKTASGLEMSPSNSRNSAPRHLYFGKVAMSLKTFTALDGAWRLVEPRACGSRTVGCLSRARRTAPSLLLLIRDPHWGRWQNDGP